MGLQSVHRLYGEDMAPQSVLDVCGAVPAERIKGIFTTCMSNNFDALTALGDDLLAEGFPVSRSHSKCSRCCLEIAPSPSATCRRAGSRCTSLTKSGSWWRVAATCCS